jgi:two-component system response regulator RegX3
MKGNVLIIEDEPDLADLIRMYLEDEGISTSICLTAEEALEQVEKGGWDLITLDLNLPEMDGFEFLQTLRRENDIPVIIVSARQADEDIIAGLGTGADEFVVKPFSPKVLAARVRALIRRSRSGGKGKRVWTFGPFRFEPDGSTLWKEGERVPLSFREFEILLFLAGEAGKAFKPEAIYSEVWGNRYGDLSAVAVYIQRLRKKIEQDPADPVFIQTIRGMGYRFNPDLLEKSGPS